MGITTDSHVFLHSFKLIFNGLLDGAHSDSAPVQKLSLCPVTLRPSRPPCPPCPSLRPSCLSRHLVRLNSLVTADLSAIASATAEAYRAKADHPVKNSIPLGQCQDAPARCCSRCLRGKNQRTRPTHFSPLAKIVGKCGGCSSRATMLTSIFLKPACSSQ
jgi:hypothetical protein